MDFTRPMIEPHDSVIQHSGNGSTSIAYTVPFPFQNTGDLKVRATHKQFPEDDHLLVLGTDFNVTGHDELEGDGEIKTTTSWSAFYTITIYRDMEAAQTLSLPEGSRFPSANMERALDKLTLLVQQTLRKLKSCLRVGENVGAIEEIDRANDGTLVSNPDGTLYMAGREEMLEWLSLPNPVLNFPTKAWLDDSSRTAAVPDFLGQIGAQRNNKSLWCSTGTNAGEWIMIPVSGSVTAGQLASTLDVSGKNLTLPSSAIGNATATTAGLDNDEVLLNRVDLTPDTLVRVPLRAIQPPILTASWKGLTAKTITTSKLRVTADEIALRAATIGGDGNTYCSFGAISIDIDISILGAGGRDTGSEEGEKWYYAWLISDGTTLSALLSLSKTAPTLPAGYKFKALVSAVYNSLGGAFEEYLQYGNDVTYIDRGHEIVYEQSGTGEFISTASAVKVAPPIAVKIRGYAGQAASSAATARAIFVSHPSVLSPKSGGTFTSTTTANVMTGLFGSVQFECAFNGSSISWSTTGTTANNYTICATGFSLSL